MGRRHTLVWICSVEWTKSIIRVLLHSVLHVHFILLRLNVYWNHFLFTITNRSNCNDKITKSYSDFMTQVYRGILRLTSLYEFIIFRLSNRYIETLEYRVRTSVRIFIMSGFFLFYVWTQGMSLIITSKMKQDNNWRENLTLWKMKQDNKWRKSESSLSWISPRVLFPNTRPLNKVFYCM